MNFVNLLTSSGGADGSANQWMTYVLLGVMVVAFVAFFIFQNRRQKKQQEEQKSIIDALRPGNKVKTIGGVCGIVVEVNKEENTFVLESGNELNGKSYLKFDIQAIYQTDAKPDDKKDDSKEESPEGKEEETTSESAE
ncbi:MAG: preprotein translocase subunit YajC [Clostridia bacterium]|nr:preprotein translocase subunit YajC [Clostridia bacterium]